MKRKRFSLTTLRERVNAARLGGRLLPGRKAAPVVSISLAVVALATAVRGGEAVVDFERAEVATRVTEWVDEGVSFKLAHAPLQTKAPGRMVFFEHHGTGRKGILCAMAMEPIPVEVRLPTAASSVTLVLWGSTGCAAWVKAFDVDGNVVDHAAVEAVPRRKAPGEPVPLFELTVRGRAIALVRFGGPREGEYLAADEVRFVKAEE